MTKARAIADITEGLILATVDIAAPIERVFQALTDPAELPKWWGSADMYQTTAMTADLRAGGAWRTDGIGSEGAPFSVGGVYKVVEPPHRLDFTWKPDWDDFETEVSYRLQDIDGATRVTVRHSGFGDHAASCGNHAFGWERVLAWLTAHVATPDARQAWFVRLVPPRPSFALDLSADERAIMMSHSAYWRQHLGDGSVVAFGPVNDPAGSFGLGVLRVAGPDALQAFQAGDPAMQSGLGFRYESFPMFSLVTA